MRGRDAYLPASEQLTPRSVMSGKPAVLKASFQVRDPRRVLDAAKAEEALKGFAGLLDVKVDAGRRQVHVTYLSGQDQWYLERVRKAIMGAGFQHVYRL